MISIVRIWLEKRDLDKIVFLVFLSVLIKIVVISNVQVVNPDGVRYVNSAYQLLQGNFQGAFIHEKMLFYPLTLGLFHFFVNDWFLAGQILSGLFLTLTLIPLFYLTRDLFGAKAGFWAGISFVVIPAINEMATEIIKGGPFLFFMAMAIFLGVRSLKTKKIYLFPLTSLCAILAVLYRLEGVVFIFVYFLALIFLSLKKEERKIYLKGLCGYLIVPLAAVLFVVGLCISGFIDGVNLGIILQRFSGDYFKDLPANFKFLYDYLETAENQFPNGRWGKDIIEIVRHNLTIIYLLGLLEKLVKGLWAVFLIPLALGITHSDKKRTGVHLLFWAIFAFFLMNFFFILTRNFLSQRYVMVVVLMLMPFTGLGMERLFQWSEKQKHPNLIYIFMLFLLFVPPAIDSFENSTHKKTTIREAGDWLKSHVKSEHKKILASGETALFHAGLYREQYEHISINNSITLKIIARKKDWDLIVLEDFKDNKKFRPLLKSYSLVREFRGEKGNVLIYEPKSGITPYDG